MKLQKQGANRSVLIILGALYLAHSAYLGVTASPDVFYVSGVFAHHFGGLVLAILFTRLALRGLRVTSGSSRTLGRTALVLFVAAVVAAVVLVELHNTRATSWILHLHIILASVSVLFALSALASARSTHAIAGWALRIGGCGVGGAAVVAVVLVSAEYATGPGDNLIRNPARPPFAMTEESMGGADGPFFPSSAATSTGGRIPSDFFMTSKSCSRCHNDIYEAWQGSAHHFSSFNNQWYRKSIEYMQNTGAVEASKWCAGCHDHAVLFNGMMDQPVEAFIETQEAHTGIGCNSCHAITRVSSSMGNGSFHIEYPPLHDLAVSDNPALRWLHDYALRLDPEPHRQVFLKPFHREQTAEFCSSCHKVHLDEPVNDYRWLRGFNEYDNWQASGVSGQGARSFYYPPAPLDCGDCHMPTVPSQDPGHTDGLIHDHSFLAANTAVPSANLDETQLRRTIEFLQQDQVSVDIFAAGPVRASENGSGTMVTAERGDSPQLASHFAAGEEAAMAVGRGGGRRRQLAPLWAPLDRADIEVHRGEETRIDVVVRTLNVGHFFPGGTVDAYDVWLELKATDETGLTVFWSGVVEDGGSGPVDPGAHFYASRMVDGHGNPIDKRNAFAARTVAWINLIPPGAADVAHFRLAIPEECGDEITLEARLNYRKFTHFNTHFSFSGMPAPGEPAAAGPGIERVNRDHDDREFVFGSVPDDVSAQLRQVPDLPIVVMALDTLRLRVVDSAATTANQSPAGETVDRGRWNDFGIGLLRQGDLQGARRAFTKVTDLDPDYADGWVNLARVALREGLLDDAESALNQSLAIAPDLAKSHYFLGVVRKEQGQYDAALEHMHRARLQYPRDRVVRNSIGRILFLQRNFADAVEELQQVLSIDPEDLMAHYNLMLCYRGLGKNEEADAQRRLYERFKADEDAQMILGPYLRDNPEDNRMRQKIHEQVSASAQTIVRESALRRQHGDPHVVLPGQAAAYAHRVIERGRRLIEAGEGSNRHLGPVEAESVQPTPMPSTVNEAAKGNKAVIDQVKSDKQAYREDSDDGHAGS
jgi:tetratricopeptide (TPR) repeat protein